MQSAIVRSTAPAMATAPSWGTPNISNTPARSSTLWASCWSKNSSPAPGVCQILANSCHSKSGSPRPAASETHERTRSARVLTNRTTKPPPQSWPTKVDRAPRPQPAQLPHEPRDVLLLGGAEAVGSGATEARELKGHHVVTMQTRPHAIPHCRCLRDTVNEHGRHRDNLLLDD